MLPTNATGYEKFWSNPTEAKGAVFQHLEEFAKNLEGKKPWFNNSGKIAFESDSTYRKLQPVVSYIWSNISWNEAEWDKHIENLDSFANFLENRFDIKSVSKDEYQKYATILKGSIQGLTDLKNAYQLKNDKPVQHTIMAVEKRYLEDIFFPKIQLLTSFNHVKNIDDLLIQLKTFDSQLDGNVDDNTLENFASNFENLIKELNNLKIISDKTDSISDLTKSLLLKVKSKYYENIIDKVNFDVIATKFDTNEDKNKVSNDFIINFKCISDLLFDSNGYYIDILNCIEKCNFKKAHTVEQQNNIVNEKIKKIYDLAVERKNLYPNDFDRNEEMIDFIKLACECNDNGLEYLEKNRKESFHTILLNITSTHMSNFLRTRNNFG